MGLFGKKQQEVPGLIGVDIGAGGMKAVELIPEKGRVRLATYGFADRKQVNKTLLLDSPKEAAMILARIVRESDMKSKRANASLPSQSIFHAIITIPRPKTVKEDIKMAIESQVRKLSPIPIEEMILDSTVIDKHLLPKTGETEKKIQQAQSGDLEPESKHIRVLVSGAPKDLVAKYVEVFKIAKLELVSLETEAFALIRSLVGRDKARIMIVDIGYERTNITIVNEGIPFLHRSIKAGGINVTEMMAKQMGVALDVAEQAKRDLSFSFNKTKLPDSLKEAMMPILHEVRYALELYAGQDFHTHTSVEKIIVTGGSAQLPQIDTFLSEALDVSVYLGDPWARIIAPQGLRPVLDEIGSRFAVSIGLAMKDLEKKQ